MFKRLAGFLVTGLMIMVLLAACGGDNGGDNGSSGGSSGGGDSVSVTMTEFKFEPATIEAAAGASVTVELSNDGSVRHDMTFDDLGGQKVQEVVDAGQSGELTFTAPTEPGEYEFYCAEPGHKEAGMVGKLVVK